MIMLKFCFCFFLEEDDADVAEVDLVAFFGALGAAMAGGGDEGGVLKFASFDFVFVDDSSPKAVAIMALATGS